MGRSERVVALSTSNLHATKPSWWWCMPNHHGPWRLETDQNAWRFCVWFFYILPNKDFIHFCLHFILLELLHVCFYWLINETVILLM
jgi:hypothetical protein